MTKQINLVKSINYFITDNSDHIILNTKIILTDDTIIYGICRININLLGNMYMRSLYINYPNEDDLKLANSGIGTWMLYTLINYIFENKLNNNIDNPEFKLDSSEYAIEYYKNIGFIDDNSSIYEGMKIDFNTLYFNLNQIMINRKIKKITEPQKFLLEQEIEKCDKHKSKDECIINKCL